jgi:hypothetical protein
VSKEVTMMKYPIYGTTKYDTSPKKNNNRKSIVSISNNSTETIKIYSVAKTGKPTKKATLIPGAETKVTDRGGNVYLIEILDDF